ncbi:MAG: tetratricopeptide repeat protein [Planctomycetes bacterium]|nr:tetratricopeptide repeat protein [Planctomycetota bacterium]
MKKRELDPAAEILQELTRDPAAEALVFQRLAEIYVARNDLPKAVKTLRDGLERAGKRPELSLLLSRIYLKLEQFKDAQAALERARADGAADKDVAMLLGTCLGHQNDFAGAEREFQRALEAGYEPKIVKYNLALILVQRGEYVRGKELLEAALAIEPQWPEARRELAHVVLLSQKDLASVNQALDVLIDVKDQLKDDWHVFEYIGDAWLLLGDYDASIAAYTDALRLGRNPKSVEEKYVVAKKKQKEKAEAASAAGGAPPR